MFSARGIVCVVYLLFRLRIMNPLVNDAHAWSPGFEGSSSKVLLIAKLYLFTPLCMRTLPDSLHLLQILQLSITGFCLSINTMNTFHHEKAVK